MFANLCVYVSGQNLRVAQLDKRVISTGIMGTRCALFPITDRPVERAKQQVPEPYMALPDSEISTAS